VLGSKCTAEIISKEYDAHGIQAAIHKLRQLKTKAKDSHQLEEKALDISKRNN